MLPRRIASSRPLRSGRSFRRSQRTRSSTGMIRSLHSMVLSATDATITMAVAADSPPRYVISVSSSQPSAIGRARIRASPFTEPSGKRNKPPSAIGRTNRLMTRR
jgi:hypothetical protein